MNRISVQSSNLKSVGYDADTNVLEIEFRHGGIYIYFDVPQNVYDELMSAPSHGEYHAKYIKNIYRYQKVN